MNEDFKQTLRDYFNDDQATHHSVVLFFEKLGKSFRLAAHYMRGWGAATAKCRRNLKHFETKPPPSRKQRLRQRRLLKRRLPTPSDAQRAIYESTEPFVLPPK